MAPEPRSEPGVGLPAATERGTSTRENDAFQRQRNALAPRGAKGESFCSPPKTTCKKEMTYVWVRNTGVLRPHDPAGLAIADAQQEIAGSFQTICWEDQVAPWRSRIHLVGARR